MIARFPGTCSKCGVPFVSGTVIDYNRETHSAAHASCPPQEAKPPQSEELRLNLQSIMDFVHAARERGLRWPKLRFLAPPPYAPRSELRLGLSGDASRFPGSLQVKVNDTWLGSVRPDGSVTGILAEEKAVLEALRIVANDPQAAAASYAAVMCRCSFCGLQLTDEGSVAFGYGPICARHYGLPHIAVGTKTVDFAGSVTVPSEQAEPVSPEEELEGLIKEELERLGTEEKE